jgi:hypothetical protein
VHCSEHCAAGRKQHWITFGALSAPRLNGTAAELHRSWMVPLLNGTAAEWHCSSIRHVWVWKFCFMQVTFCRSVSCCRPYCLHVDGQAVPTDTRLTPPDPEDNGVTIFRNVSFHAYLHKDTTSHRRRHASLAIVHWQYKTSDRNTKIPDCPLCPFFCIFPYSKWRTGDRMSVKFHAAKVCHNQHVSYSPTANTVTHTN